MGWGGGAHKRSRREGFVAKNGEVSVVTVVFL